MHRARLIANFLPEFGWQPLVLTVHERYYEEPPDYDLLQTVSPQVQVVKTRALPVVKLFGKRLIGDIGIRGFFHLYREALKIIRSQPTTNPQSPITLWIPIPSWYTALLGRLLHARTGIPYGIDYIDPWVSKLADHHKPLSRAWWTNQLARFLEPIAVKKAALITGVSTAYYQGVLDRNFRRRPVAHAGMPYGFDPHDHEIVLTGIGYPWPAGAGLSPLVYAGAFLPQSHLFIDGLFHAVASLRASGLWDERIRLYFLGTGAYGGKSIETYARDHGVQDIVTERRERFPYLHILNFLREAAGVLVVGSTERHYTASKTFQSLLSGRPVYAVFHEASSAVEVMDACQAGQYTVRYREDADKETLFEEIRQKLLAFIQPAAPWSPDLAALDAWSARESARRLVEGMEGEVKE